MAKHFFPITNTKIDPFIDDSNDVLYEKDSFENYGMVGDNRSNSTTLIKMVTAFGRSRGFNLLLTRIKSKKNWLPIQVLHKIMKFMGGLQAVFYREFALLFLPKFLRAVVDNITNTPMDNLRNFTKEIITDITEDMSRLAKRYMSIGEKNEFIESFNLAIASLCFHSSFLGNQVMGLLMILDILKKVRMGRYKFLNKPAIVRATRLVRYFVEILAEGAQGI